MLGRISTLSAALALAACATPQTPTAAANSPGMVSAADPRAAAAGVEMLRQGGTAADAAFATMLALTVVEPQSSGIGGGGFLVYDDGDGSPQTYDGRETAPMAATGDWFLVEGKPMPFDQAQPGGKSVGVPGNIRLIADAHREHGKLPWKTLFQPAIRLARDGFAVTKRLHFALARGDDEGWSVAGLTPAGRALYFGADGKPVPVGTTIRNPALADFLEQLAERGPDYFYVGTNAQAIAATVQNAPRNPAPMTVGDIASYDAKERPPVCGSYRGHRICGMGPPSSGATTVFAILKQLERFDLRGLGSTNPVSWHLIAESMRLAYADRDKYLGDGDFVSVPVAGLTDPAYLASRSALISPDRTLPSVSAGVPAGAPAPCAVTTSERGTSHFVAVDRWGNVASETSTIESAFGSGLIVNGYFLNNELTDFSFVPEVSGCPVANRVEGGKRPRSSMSPTIVYGPDGKVRLAVGAAGGSTIIVQVAKAIIGVIDWNLTAQQALALPTLFAPGRGTVYLERGTYLEAMAPRLRELGHAKVELISPGTFKANAIERRDGDWQGAADPRSEGAAVSE